MRVGPCVASSLQKPLTAVRERWLGVEPQNGRPAPRDPARPGSLTRELYVLQQRSVLRRTPRSSARAFPRLGFSVMGEPHVGAALDRLAACISAPTGPRPSTEPMYELNHLDLCGRARRAAAGAQMGVGDAPRGRWREDLARRRRLLLRDLRPARGRRSGSGGTCHRPGCAAKLSNQHAIFYAHVGVAPMVPQACTRPRPRPRPPPLQPLGPLLPLGPLPAALSPSRSPSPTRCPLR